MPAKCSKAQRNSGTSSSSPMSNPRISASSYSNTAPLVWSFLYGNNHGKVEIILDNAPARSAELLEAGRVDAALIPVIAYQLIDDVRLIPGVCVGAAERVRSVCLITRGMDLADVRSVSLDTSSRTSVSLTKIMFREFLGFEPAWSSSQPDIDEMLRGSDAALLIGDPALRLSAAGATPYRLFDLAELWHRYTGLGFVFAMWVSRNEVIDIDFAAARDEGLAHLGEIAENYSHFTGIDADEMRVYLTQNISFEVDGAMQRGMELYFDLAAKNGLIPGVKPLRFT